MHPILHICITVLIDRRSNAPLEVSFVLKFRNSHSFCSNDKFYMCNRE